MTLDTGSAGLDVSTRDRAWEGKPARDCLAASETPPYWLAASHVTWNAAACASLSWVGGWNKITQCEDATQSPTRRQKHTNDKKFELGPCRLLGRVLPGPLDGAGPWVLILADSHHSAAMGRGAHL